MSAERAVAAGSTWSSCLVVVAAYSDVAPAVSRAVSRASDAVRLSPALADFIELRFLSLGPRGLDEDERDDAVDAVLDELTGPTRGAPVTYLGAVLVDDGTGTVRALLDACAARFAELEVEVELAGIAVTEPRSPAPVGEEAPTVALAPGPRLEERLAAMLARRCDELMRTYAAGARPGLSAEDLAAIRDPIPETLAARSAAAPVVETGARLARRRVDSARRLVESDGDTTSDEPAEKGATLEPDPSASGTNAVSADAARTDRRAQIAAAVHLVLVGDVRSSWRRVRSIALALDQGLAKESGEDLAIGVRILGNGRAGGSALVPAGRLHRRSIRRPDEFGDFAQQLQALGRSMATLPQPHHYTTRPAVVLVTGEPPPADVIAIDVYRRIAERASVLWIVVGEERLLSAVYRQRATVLIDHDAIVDEAIEHLLVGWSTADAL